MIRWCKLMKIEKGIMGILSMGDDIDIRYYIIWKTVNIPHTYNHNMILFNVMCMISKMRVVPLNSKSGAFHWTSKGTRGDSKAGNVGTPRSTLVPCLSLLDRTWKWQNPVQMRVTWWTLIGWDQFGRWLVQSFRWIWVSARFSDWIMTVVLRWLVNSEFT